MKAFIGLSKKSLSPMNGVPPEEAGKPVKTLQGYWTYHVKIEGFGFRFATLGEMEYCIRALFEKNLPTEYTFHKNSHWLSRLPGWVKTWKYRQKAVTGLAEALRQFRKHPEKMVTGDQDPTKREKERYDRKSLPSRMKSAIRKKQNPKKS